MPASLSARSGVRRYGVAVLTSTAALALTLAMPSVLGRVPFVFFYLAVVISALVGGTGPALASTVLAIAAVDWFLVDPIHSFRLRSPADVVPFVAFAAVAYLISGITESLRRQRLAADQRAAEVEGERARVRAIVESAGDGIYTIDLHGVCTMINPAAAALLGYTQDELLGRNMHGIIHYAHADGAPAPERECPIARAFRAGERVHVPDDVFWRRDGTMLSVEYTSAPITEGGVITGAVVTFVDITARNRSRAVDLFLADSTRVLAESLDFEPTVESLARLSVPILGESCVIDTVEDGVFGPPTVAHVDPAEAEAIRDFRTRYPLHLHDDHPVVQAFETGLPVDLTELSESRWQRSATAPEQIEMMRALQPRSGMSIPLVARGRRLGVVSFAARDRRYGPGDVALAQELARRAAVAIDNARLYRDAQQATRARDDILAIVSHDLRNPVHTIFMSAAWLLELYPEGVVEGEAVRTQALIIRRSADRANRLIGDLLDVTRIEAGRLVVERRPEGVDSLVVDTVETFLADARDRGIELTADVQGHPPVVIADRERVLQLLANLVGNALKFTSRGGRVSLRVSPADGGARFAVHDTGSGIAAEQLPHLFDRFWQAHRADRRGVGLGLSIAKGIAEAHNAVLSVDSVLGVGSTFSFTLPAVAAQADAMPGETPAPQLRHLPPTRQLEATRRSASSA